MSKNRREEFLKDFQNIENQKMQNLLIKRYGTLENAAAHKEEFIEKAEDLYRASIKTADDKKLFALYMEKGNRDISFPEFKELYGGSASAAEEALKSKKTWAEISEARQQATALEKELDAESINDFIQRTKTIIDKIVNDNCFMKI